MMVGFNPRSSLEGVEVVGEVNNERISICLAPDSRRAGSLRPLPRHPPWTWLGKQVVWDTICFEGRRKVHLCRSVVVPPFELGAGV